MLSVTNIARMLELGSDVMWRHVVLTSVSKNCQPEGHTHGHSQPMQFLEQRHNDDDDDEDDLLVLKD